MAKTSPFMQVFNERSQGAETRKPILRKLEKLLEMPVLAYYTSFKYPVAMSPDDVQMMEGVLQGMDLSRGLAVIVSSPGGDPLTAEGVIRVCRSYSSTDDFVAVVPGQAKSAATMVCMGARKIVMGPASELGPVDPQVARVYNETVKWYSVHNIVRSYETLFNEAVLATGRIEPYLQQLQTYDAQEIEEFRAAIRLSEDIAVRALKSGMLGGSTDEEIREKIKIFLEPEERTVVHGRAIHREEAQRCGLEIDYCDLATDAELWRAVYTLHVRLSEFVSNQVSKTIETKTDSYWTGVW